MIRVNRGARSDQLASSKTVPPAQTTPKNTTDQHKRAEYIDVAK